MPILLAAGGKYTAADHRIWPLESPSHPDGVLSDDEFSDACLTDESDDDLHQGRESPVTPHDRWRRPVSPTADNKWNLAARLGQAKDADSGDEQVSEDAELADLHCARVSVASY